MVLWVHVGNIIVSHPTSRSPLSVNSLQRFEPRRTTASTKASKPLPLAVPGHDDLFLLNRYGPHWSEITEDDILTIDLEGRVVDGEGEWETSAFMIHRGCHQARPSARAVFHTHMPYATALSLTVGGFDSKLSQNAMLFHGRTAHMAYGGLVDAAEEGSRFGEVIGEHVTVVMLANHGVMVIGEDVADAWQKLYFFERACNSRWWTITGQPLYGSADCDREQQGAWMNKPEGGDQFAAPAISSTGARMHPSLRGCLEPPHQRRLRTSRLASRPGCGR